MNTTNSSYLIVSLSPLTLAEDLAKEQLGNMTYSGSKRAFNFVQV